MADEDAEKFPPSSDVPDTDEEAPAPSTSGERWSSDGDSRAARKTRPATADATPAHRLSRTAQSALSPFAQAEKDASSKTNLDVNTTQESAALEGAEVDRHYFLERRVAILEEETNQLNARIRLAEKGVEDARRLAMAASVFALGAMIVAKLLNR